MLLFETSSENASPAPLVISLHGWTSNASDQLRDGWDNIARNRPLVLIRPQGMSDLIPKNDTKDKDKHGWATDWNSWNAIGDKSPTACGPGLEAAECYESCSEINMCANGCECFTCVLTFCFFDPTYYVFCSLRSMIFNFLPILLLTQSRTFALMKIKYTSLVGLMAE